MKGRGTQGLQAPQTKVTSRHTPTFTVFLQWVFPEPQTRDRSVQSTEDAAGSRQNEHAGVRVRGPGGEPR